VGKALSLEEMLLRDEGERLKVYLDSRGISTIGVGRNLRDTGISQDESRFLFKNDIERVRWEVGQALPWTLWMVGARRAVIYAMAFQLGTSGLLGFKKMLEAVKGQYWDAAAHEMRESLWYKQVPERAERMAKQMETGEWQ